MMNLNSMPNILILLQIWHCAFGRWFILPELIDVVLKRGSLQ